MESGTPGRLWREAFLTQKKKKNAIIFIEQKPNTLTLTIMHLYFRRFGPQILKGWAFHSVLLLLSVVDESSP